MSEKPSLFDKLYEKADEAIKLLKKPLVKKQVKRKLATASDSAENKIIDANVTIQDLRADFANFDVNKILEQQLIIEENQNLQKKISEEYSNLFGKSMPKDE